MDKKKELIIQGAIKRFIHYGINKTTMNEIADDLSVSKPSLYYYFPDKASLIHSVVNKIVSDYFDVLHKEKPSDSLEATLSGILTIKHKFFQKYYMLHFSFGTIDPTYNTEKLKELITDLKNKELEFHAAHMQRAMDEGEIATGDSKHLAELYLQSIAGMTSLCINNGNKELMPNKKTLKLLNEKQMQLSEIFIKGLRS